MVTRTTAARASLEEAKIMSAKKSLTTGKLSVQGHTVGLNTHQQYETTQKGVSFDPAHFNGGSENAESVLHQSR